MNRYMVRVTVDVEVTAANETVAAQAVTHDTARWVRLYKTRRIDVEVLGVVPVPSDD